MTNWKLGLAVFTLFLPIFANTQTPTPGDALALEQQGKFAEAAAAWHRIAQQHPSDAAAFASLGLALSKQGKYVESVPVYRKAIALNPGLPGVQLNLGLAEFKLGHFQSAIPPLSAALGADPDNLQVRTLLGMSCYGAKRFAEAAKYLNTAAKADPGNVQLHQVLAQSCLAAKEYSCALEEFRQILERDPDSSAAHMLAGEALDGLGRTPEAVAEFQTAAATAPREPNVHFGLGYLYWKLHQYDDAKPAFEQELINDPGHAQALAYLGDIELKRNNLEQALLLLKKAVQLRKDIRIAYLDTGAILAEQHHYRDAILALQHAEKLDPEQPDAHLRLGRLYKSMGNTAAAEKEFAMLRQLHQKADEDIAAKMSGGSPQSHQ